eukprot:947989-Amphidinium_carterae.1
MLACHKRSAPAPQWAKQLVAAAAKTAAEPDKPDNRPEGQRKGPRRNAGRKSSPTEDASETEADKDKIAERLRKMEESQRLLAQAGPQCVLDELQDAIQEARAQLRA